MHVWIAKWEERAMALTEKQKTAYHEGGHCYRAWRYHFLAVKNTCIFEQPPGEWWGKTPNSAAIFY